MSARDSTPPALPKIDRRMLREQDDAARIERVWERLDRNLVLREPSTATRQSVQARRWPWVGVAAGFALGIAASSWLLPRAAAVDPTVVALPGELESQQDVFAAGAAQRSYALPGGGMLTLEPNSMVETVSRDGTLKLRLLQGEATLTAPAGHAAAGHWQRRPLALLVGNALLRPAGNVRVRHSGDTALVHVIDGTAAVSAPDGERGMRDMVLGPRDQDAVVPIRVMTASLDQHDIRGVSPVSSADPIEAPSDAPPVDEPPSEALPAVVLKPWAHACTVGRDDVKALELFNQSGESLADIHDTTLLGCLALGQLMLGKPDVPLLERLANGTGSDSERATFAGDLARIYKKRGELDKAQHYDALNQELSKGRILTERGLCDKVQADAKAGKHADVVRIGAVYLAQFPTGECIPTVKALLAAQPIVAGPRPPTADGADGADEPDGDDAPDPYEEPGAP